VLADALLCTSSKAMLPVAQCTLKEKHRSAVVSFVHPKFLESRDKLPQKNVAFAA
jgi:hypothetical protein